MSISNFNFVFLGQSVLRYQVPFDVYDTINHIYESKYSELKPANKQLVGKIEKEHSLFYQGEDNDKMTRHNYLPQDVLNWFKQMFHHYLNWNLVGYYDLTNIWISEKGIDEKKNLVWVDLNILPKQGRAIGGHIVSLNDDTPPGFQSSCNPNILANITADKFHMKFPFSTIIYLLWLNKIKIKPIVLRIHFILKTSIFSKITSCA